MKAVGCDLYNFQLTGGVACALNANTGLSANHAGPSVLIAEHKKPQTVRFAWANSGCAGLSAAESAPTVKANRNGEPAVAVYDARGNGEGVVCPTITGDHNAYISDYTALAVSVGNGQLHQMEMATAARPLDCMHDQQAILCVATQQGRAEIMKDKCPTITAAAGMSGNNQPYICKAGQERKYIVRRLTPTECGRLQGFPDGWTDGANGSDSAIYKMWGNGIALPCAADVIGRLAKEANNGKTV